MKFLLLSLFTSEWSSTLTSFNRYVDLGKRDFESLSTLLQFKPSILMISGYVSVCSNQVKPKFHSIYKEEFPDSFGYRSRAILLFQKIENVDVCLFVFYTMEYGENAKDPNYRRYAWPVSLV